MNMTIVVAGLVAMAPLAFAQDAGNRTDSNQTRKIMAEVVSVDMSTHAVTLRVRDDVARTGNMGGARHEDHGTHARHDDRNTSAEPNPEYRGTAGTGATGSGRASGYDNRGSEAGRMGDTTVSTNTTSSTRNDTSNGWMAGQTRLTMDMAANTITLQFTNDDELRGLAAGDTVEVTCRGRRDTTAGGMSSGTTGTTTMSNNPLAQCNEITDVDEVRGDRRTTS